MAKQNKDVVKKGCYRMTAVGFKPALRKRAKFAPELIALGLAEGVSSEQGNLIRGMFDKPDDNKVDSFSNIHSDKFLLMDADMAAASPAPVDTPKDTE